MVLQLPSDVCLSSQPCPAERVNLCLFQVVQSLSRDIAQQVHSHTLFGLQILNASHVVTYNNRNASNALLYI